jgi:hypothetical protein
VSRRTRRAAAPEPRERVGREQPGAVLRGPPITVRCECGGSASLPHGARWTCDGCGRSYDTARIPREEYDAIRRLQLRYRVLPIVFGLIVVALGVVFTLTGAVMSVFILLPFALITWFAFLRPVHQRRYRGAIADRPTWDLRADA